MNLPQHIAESLKEAFTSPLSSERLAAALAAGTHPNEEFVSVLFEQCKVEPDFYVRDMLTWALLRHDKSQVMEGIKAELKSSVPQARSQALHTLSKYGDLDSWGLITQDLLLDVDDEVARAAWRAAVAIVPESDKRGLAETLLNQLGRGPLDTWLSLSRALITLWSVVESQLEDLSKANDEPKSSHAKLTLNLANNPEAADSIASSLAEKIDLLAGAPKIAEVAKHSDSAPE